MAPGLPSVGSTKGVSGTGDESIAPSTPPIGTALSIMRLTASSPVVLSQVPNKYLLKSSVVTLRFSAESFAHSNISPHPNGIISSVQENQPSAIAFLSSPSIFSSIS